MKKLVVCLCLVMVLLVPACQPALPPGVATPIPFPQRWENHVCQIRVVAENGQEILSDQFDCTLIMSSDRTAAIGGLHLEGNLSLVCWISKDGPVRCAAADRIIIQAD